MKRTLIVALAAALLQLAPAPPALAQSREHRQMLADIRMLQEQTQQLAITLAALNDALKALNTKLDEQTNAMRKAFADQKLIVDNVGSDLRVIRERVDETNVRISTLGQELEALRMSIPVAPAAVPGTEGAGTEEGATPGATPAAPPTAGLSPTRMYETAWADYTAGQWSLALTGFDAFLKTFPKSELADEAQFYIGETYFASGKYQEAVNAYNQVIQTYPGSNSTPLAHYKQGLAHERLGQIDEARAAWELVISKFPESDAGRLAKQNLDRLGKKP